MLLEKDSSKRIGKSFEEVEKLKKHKFFESINWKLIEKRQSSPVFQPSSREIENYLYFPNYNEFDFQPEFAIADDYENIFNEASETPVLIKEFSFF